MSSEDPKKSQLKGKFQITINTSNHQNNPEDPKDEEKSQKPPQLSEENILTTISSFSPNNQKAPMDISNDQNMNIKKKQIYSFSSDYYDELYLNLILDEQRFYQKINCNYMNFQSIINDKMRAILVDWIIDIHYKLNMQSKTLFQCVYIIDAYLSKNIIERTNFQLLGIAAFLIACKENEVNYPPLSSFLAYSDNAYTLKQLTDMEVKVIQKLDYDIFAPTAEEFFAINSEYFEFTEKQRFFGEYFLDASLIHYKLLKYKPSTIAVACGYIVIQFFKLNGIHLIIDNTNKNVTRKDVKNCAKDLLFLVKNLSKSSLKATKNKYMSNKYMNVAQLWEED